MRKLRKGACRQQGRLENIRGETVSSEHRADTLAEYLELVQWEVRPVKLVHQATDSIRAELPVRLDAFDERELREAIKKAKTGKNGKPIG